MTNNNKMKNSQLMAMIKNHLVNYPTPVNLTYAWSFGSLAGLCLAIQIITGLFLAMHYVPHIDYAFASIEHILREVNYGWLIKYTHSNGASFFFITVYLHIARGIYYESYRQPRQFLWISGVILFILMMATAFLGYVLPWGQMSFWGATVITNLFTAIPFIGKPLTLWIWGGFSIGNPTLTRIYAIHFILPFIILALVIVHLILLHQHGSTNPLGQAIADKITFYPYFYAKDLFSFITLIFFLSIFIFFYPNYLGHPDNYIPANSILTPLHIVPEWYFLPFYAMLRSIPNKLGGVTCMALALLVLFVLPFFPMYNLNNEIRNFTSGTFRPLFRVFFSIWVSNIFLLGYIGSSPVTPFIINLGLFATSYYFIFLLVIIPFLPRLEQKLLRL